MTLPEFLLARFAEDEADVAFAVSADERWCWGGPERVLAECAAKRRIVERHAGHLGNPNEPYPAQYATFRPGCDTLRFQALPYADHPDYDEEWRP